MLPSFLPLLLLCSALQATPTLAECPSCRKWAGGDFELCGIDGQTYQTKCDLFVALCHLGIISAGPDVDINTINLEAQVDDFIASVGACQDDNVIGTCPKCEGVTDPTPVCATTGTAAAESFSSYCELARTLCRKGIIGFSENSDFTVFTESDYAQHVNDYTDWEGPCDGLCPAGRYSPTGRYGPCVECDPGTFTNKLASKSCNRCAIGSYQAESGKDRCLECPPGHTTESMGSKSRGDCISRTPCTPGTSSATGFEPCTACPQDNYNDVDGALVCKPCPDGKQTDGEGATSADQCKLENLAPRGTATQSNVTWGGVPEKAIDGDLTQSCHAIECAHTGFQVRPWWQVDLGQKYTIGSVMVWIPRDTMTGLDGARVTVDGTQIGTIFLSNTTLGVAIISCNIQGQVVRIESDLGIPTYLAVSEVHVYGGDPETKCPLGTTSPTGFLPCQTCPRRYTTFKKGATTCTKCPRDQTTTLKNPGKCIGQVLRVCRHDNLNPPCEELEHSIPSVDTHQVGWLRDISALEAIRGNWVVYSRPNFQGSSMVIGEGRREGDLRKIDIPGTWYQTWNDNIRSIRLTEHDYDCYSGDGSSYTGRESRTRDGKNCQEWSYDWPNQPTLTESSLPSNYCRNKGGSMAAPWCYVTERGGPIKELCDIQKC